MRPVTVYTTAFCCHCDRAVALLTRKGAPVTVIDATFDPAKREEMRARAGRCSYPQIFIGDAHLGGCAELQALEAAGGLDALLKGA